MSSPIRPQDPYRPPQSSLDALDRSATAAGWAGTAGLVPSWTERGDAAHIERLGDELTGTIARDPSGFAEAMAAAFGDEADLQSVNALIDAALAGRLAVPPVRIVEPGALGGGVLGAYAATGGPGGGPLIVLDRTLLADEARLTRVFTEEVGHHLDAVLRGADSAGDEGEVFAAALLGGADGQALPPSAFARMAAENDRGTVLLDGRTTAVEFHAAPSPVGGSPNPGTQQSGQGSTSGADGAGGSSGAGDTAEDEADEAGRETSAGGTTGGASQTSGADEAEEVDEDEEEDDEDEDDTSTSGTTGGGGPGPVTEAPAQTTGGFDPSLDGTINGGVPGSPGDEREEYVTVDGGGSGGGGPGDDTAEDNVGDAGAGESGGAGGGGSGGDGAEGDGGGGSTIPGLGTVPAAPGIGFSVMPPGFGNEWDPIAGSEPAAAQQLGPVYDLPPDNIDGNPFDEIEVLQPVSGPEVQVPLAPPLDAPAGDPAESTDRPWWSNVGHFVLDVIGLIPVVGEWADALNASWYAAEGRYFEASLSAAGTVPFVGIGATVAKWFGTTRTVARADELAAGGTLSQETLDTIDRLNLHGFTDIAEAAGPALSRIGQVNVETRARISAVLDDPDIRLRPETREQLERTANAIDDHLSDADLSGALQERHGIPIESFSHGTEVNNTLRSLGRTRRDLVNRLNHGDPNEPLDSHTASTLSSTIDSINLLSATVRALLD